MKYLFIIISFLIITGCTDSINQTPISTTSGSNEIGGIPVVINDKNAISVIPLFFSGAVKNIINTTLSLSIDFGLDSSYTQRCSRIDMPVGDEKSCEQYKTLKITQTKDLKDILPHGGAIQNNLFETGCYTSISDIHMLGNASIGGSLIGAGIDTIASYTGNIMNYPLSMDWSSKNINFSTNSYIQTKETGMPVGWNNEDSFSIVPSNVVNIDDDQYLMSTGGIRLGQSAIYANIQMSECRNKGSSSPIMIDLRSIKNIGNTFGNGMRITLKGLDSHRQLKSAIWHSDMMDTYIPISLNLDSSIKDIKNDANKWHCNTSECSLQLSQENILKSKNIELRFN